MFEILVDTGGTFTDGILVDEERSTSEAKAPTHVAEPSLGILQCIERLAEGRGLTQRELLEKTSTIIISTTLAINCLVERKGAKCCFIYTEGFKDMFELRRTTIKEDIYNLKVPPTIPLIPRYLRYKVDERLQYDGKVLSPLNEEDVHEAVKRAKAENVEVPVICFLHSYANPEHEEKAAEIIKNTYSNVVVSSHIARRWIEYDRASTAAIAGYLKPVTTNFAANLERRLCDNSFKGNLLFITGAGGVTDPKLCVENPTLLVGSSPAAACVAGRFLAQIANFENVMVCDMGGTSFDLGIIPNQSISMTTEHIIDGKHMMKVESVDTTSIGAGGGSIAWIDELGMLRVGPSSMSAEPGPACYGKGGQLPTVTDANVVLGYIPADYFLGGTIPLDKGLAEKAIDKEIAKSIKLSTVEAAYAISTLVEANMADKIFLEAVKKGFDPKDFTLIGGGGCGPVHAVALALRLGIKRIYIPKHAPLIAAFGFVVTEYKKYLERFLYCEVEKIDINELGKIYSELEEEGAVILNRQGVTEKDMRFVRGAEMRYYGQLHETEALLPETKRRESFTAKDFTALTRSFHEKHQAMYDWSNPEFPVRLIVLKLQAIGKRRQFEPMKQPRSHKDPGGALKRKRPVYSKESEAFIETPCYDGDKLRHGNVIEGPAIIEETKTTVIVPDKAVLTVDEYGNYSVEV